MSPKRLIDIRLQLGLTQTELAGHLGVSRQTVNYWENAHARIPRWCWDALRFLSNKAQVLPKRREGIKNERRGPYRVDRLDNA